MHAPRVRSWGPAAAALGIVAAASAVFVAARARDGALPMPRVVSVVACDDPAAAPNSISGQVVRHEWKVPVHDVFSAEPGRTVTLVPEGRAPRTTTTDAWGRFAFTGVEPGRRHDVVVEAPERGPIRVPGITLWPSERRYVGRLELGTPDTITVPVTDEAGRPIAGAVVEAYADSPHRDWESGHYDPPDDLTFDAVPAARAVTGADGRATLPVFEGMWWTLVARAPGKARVSHPPVRISEAQFALPDAVTLHGVVRDAQGRPVASALVLARTQPPIRDDHHGVRYDSPGLWQRTYAAADGTFVFDDLGPGTVEFLAGPPGAAPFATNAVQFPESTSVAIEAPAAARVQGRVTDADGGAPVAGVVVQFQEAMCGTAWSCATGADGRYEFLAPGTGTWNYAKVIPPPGWRWLDGGGGRDFMLPGDVRTADARLARTATITGRVAGVAGSGGVGAWICVRPGVARRGPRTTFADGRFRIEEVIAGRVAAFAVLRHGGMLRDSDGAIALEHAVNDDPAARRLSEFDLPAGHVAELSLDLWDAPPDAFLPESDEAPSKRREYRVRIRVRTADGLPLRNAWTYVTSDAPPPAPDPNAPAPRGTACCPPSRDRPREEPSWAPSYDDPLGLAGTAETTQSCEPGGRIFVVASDDRHLTHHAYCDAPADRDTVDLEVVLPPRPPLSGHVVADGAPVAGARILVDGVEACRSSADGSFQVTALPRDPWISARAPGLAADGTLVRNDWTPERITLVLVRVRDLAGRVVDPDGKAVAGVRVWALGAQSRRDAVATDPDGRFVLPDVERKPVRLAVASPSWAPAPIGSFVTETIAADADAPTIVARPGLVIEGRAVHADGRPFAGLWVRLLNVGASEAFPDDPGHEATTDADGRYRLTRLTAGTWGVTFSAWEAAERTVTAEAGDRDVRVIVEDKPKEKDE